MLFSCSKDHVINVWFSHNGERLGTYDGHNGAVWTIDVDCASPRAHLYSMNLMNRSGQPNPGSSSRARQIIPSDCGLSSQANVCTNGNFPQPSKAWPLTNQMTKWFASRNSVWATRAPSVYSTSTETVMERDVCHQIDNFNTVVLIPVSSCTETSEPAHMFNPIGSKATVCSFSYVPNRIVTGHMSGKVAIYDYKTGEEVDNNERAHGDEVTDLQMSPDLTYFTTCSKDKAARLSDSPKGHQRWMINDRLLVPNHLTVASNQGPQSTENVHDRNPAE